MNDDFYAWCVYKYGSNKVGMVKVVRGVKHGYLAMVMDYSEKSKLKIDMRYYIEAMLDEFPYEVKQVKTMPCNNKLFKINKEAKKLDNELKAILYTYVMKAMFLCKQAQPNITTVIGFLSSQVKTPNKGDWDKFMQVM